MCSTLLQWIHFAKPVLLETLAMLYLLIFFNSFQSKESSLFKDNKKMGRIYRDQSSRVELVPY